MLQEIITFLIVGAAIALASAKAIKRFRKKKPKKVSYESATMAEAHNCTDCAADCVLRDLPKRTIHKSQEICDTNYIKDSKA